jgi:type II secretory pathway component GspD/PulD (secretin)
VFVGNPASIEVGRELRYATHWKKDPATSDWLPTDFETRNIGVTMLTTPRVVADGLIELDVVPTITEFEGFVELGEGLAPTSKRVDGHSPDDVPSNSKAPYQPVFSVRSLAAMIPRLRSGQTVVLRGPGRKDISRTVTTGLDGQEVESTIDSEPVSLLIFVTASIVPDTAASAQP